MLDLPVVDIVLGMDWLELHSLMKINWGHKWMSFPHKGQIIALHGVDTVPTTNVFVKLLSIEHTVVSPYAQSDHPPHIASLSKFAQLFQGPSALPPSRPCDHTIPLVPGAHAVNIRSYHYPPALKVEIERQVTTTYST